MPPCCVLLKPLRDVMRAASLSLFLAQPTYISIMARRAPTACEGSAVATE